ncbi:MAG: competence/damage-inducible protein A [Proteobacteria bacterium]|nr:competence/damage-inducible protein A [Pseudomonadota bacterium]
MTLETPPNAPSKKQESAREKKKSQVSPQEGELFPEVSFKACLLVIGNEILSGRTQDLNVQFLGETLSRYGIDLKEVRIIPDEENTIIDHIKEVKNLYDYVFTTGGIGPTHDDITTDCVARALGLPIIEDEEALKRLEAHYKDRLNETHKRMARVPFGSRLIDNPITSAPGFFIQNIYVLAGVPRIMRAMVMSLLPILKGGTPIVSQSISCTLGESLLAEDLKKLQERYPTFDIGIYPFFRPEGQGTTLVVRGKHIKTIERIVGKLKDLILNHGGSPETDVSLLFKESSSQKSFFKRLKAEEEGTHFLMSSFEWGKSYFLKAKKQNGIFLIIGGLILGLIGILFLGNNSPSPQYVQKPFFENNQVVETEN